MIRPNKDLYYLGIAEAAAKRSTCMRRHYGAIIVKNDEIIATGYNGAPRGEENCIDCGFCQREALNIPKGERYELCVSVHAEQNAIISAARRDMVGGTIYIVGLEKDGSYANPAPCIMCRRVIVNAGIVRCVGMVNGHAEELSLAPPKLSYTPRTDPVTEEIDKEVDALRAAPTFADDTTIIEALLEKWTREDLERHGFADFVKPYFEEVDD